MSLRFAPRAAGTPDGDPQGAWRAQEGRRAASGLAPALLAQGAARDGLQHLLSGARAVTTGQQAGLFAGPLYTIHKALTAAALAEALADARGEPVVPVFWVAGDDHDFDEIRSTAVLGADGRPARTALEERPASAPMLPAYRETLGARCEPVITALEAHLPPGSFRDETMAWVRGAWVPDRSMAEAFAVALAELLGPLGVVVCRGWHGAVKHTAAPVLLGAARRAAELETALVAEAGRLRAAGAEVPVTVGEGLSLLMVEGRQGRDRLRITGDGRFATRRSGEAFALDDLERLVQREPERVSGNVLLRPAVEATVFPAVAYVGGPAELAYLRQAGPVFELLGAPRPARVPRLSGFLVEAKVDKVLEKYGLQPADLGVSEGELTSRVARQDLPSSAVEALAAVREAVTRRYAALQAEAVAIDRTLERTVENARNQALVGVTELEKRLVAAVRRGSDTALQQVARARDQLFPFGEPQERVLSVVSFLARHGREVLDVIAAAAREHARAVLEAAPRRT